MMDRDPKDDAHDAYNARAAQDNNIKPFGAYSSRSSMASTPPCTSPSTYSFDDERAYQNDDSLDVYLIHPTMDQEESTYSNSSSPIPASTFVMTPPNSKDELSLEDEYMPSLVPLLPFKNNIITSSPRASFRHEKDEDDNMHIPYPAPTSGNITYHGPARADGRTEISFIGLTYMEAEEHLNSESAKYNDYHSVYIPNVVQAIESFCFCQDKIIANDWSPHMFQDGSYSGHPTIPGGAKLPIGGPRSGRTWHERPAPY
ncbi:hypothetical protein C8R48DRAFT_677840 [Suillus tomentosus]|nr:hypothetical protein C8R48DRAFT_677840 [Suillus tomentosus]